MVLLVTTTLLRRGPRDASGLPVMTTPPRRRPYGRSRAGARMGAPAPPSPTLLVTMTPPRRGQHESAVPDSACHDDATAARPPRAPVWAPLRRPLARASPSAFATPCRRSRHKGSPAPAGEAEDAGRTSRHTARGAANTTFARLTPRATSLAPTWAPRRATSVRRTARRGRRCPRRRGRTRADRR